MIESQFTELNCSLIDGLDWWLYVGQQYQVCNYYNPCYDYENGAFQNSSVYELNIYSLSLNSDTTGRQMVIHFCDKSEGKMEGKMLLVHRGLQLGLHTGILVICARV